MTNCNLHYTKRAHEQDPCPVCVIRASYGVPAAADAFDEGFNAGYAGFPNSAQQYAARSLYLEAAGFQDGWNRGHDVAVANAAAAIRLSESNARPSVELRKDRLARHYRECEENRTWAAHTIQSNMAECRIRFDLLQGYTIPNGGSPLATKAAAELYGCRQFVLGVLTGRTYALPESEQLALARSWEDLWDNTFGDLVGKVLKFQE